MPGQLSTFGDHLTSTSVKSRPILTTHARTATERLHEKELGLSHNNAIKSSRVRSKAFAPRALDDIRDDRSRPVALDTRESIKMACQRIAAGVQMKANTSQNALRKARMMKLMDGSDHDLHFSQVLRFVCVCVCFLKLMDDSDHDLHFSRVMRFVCVCVCVCVCLFVS